jgi:amidase
MSESPFAALHQLPARQLAAGIRDRRFSAVEIMSMYLRRIETLNDGLRAIVSLVPEEQALAAARAADAAVIRGERLGPLHGLPIALKDLMEVAGMRTTFGSRLHVNHVAATDCLLAERLRAAGALIIGKTNTPEQGLGTLTFNDVFGTTVNPWNHSRHAGGSSGGAAAAVAAGLLPVADGSDSGGSIRYPASFCNLVGLRPSPGRVPTARVGDGWSPHGVVGPIARDVRDAGLLLAAMAGHDPRSPIGLTEDPRQFAAIEPSDLRGVRVAWSRTVDGLPIDPQVTAVLEAARVALVHLGCVVEDVEPDLKDADRCWEILEMHEFFAHCHADVSRHRDLIRPDLVRNVDIGRSLTAEQIAWARTTRTEIYRRTARLLERYDLLALPATPVPPPPLAVEWVKEINGVSMERYFGWQRCATRITVTAHPALSVPAGFSRDGLPVGLQLIGRYRDELTLLRHAAAFEDATGWSERRPPEPAREPRS